MSAPSPAVLTAPEVAAMTGYDISTICRWARSGHLPSIRKLNGIRGAWLFDASVVQRLEHK
jgi:predicted DNA-binding transcriptional regulator AlpA